MNTPALFLGFNKTLREVLVVSACVVHLTDISAICCCLIIIPPQSHVRRVFPVWHNTAAAALNWIASKNSLELVELSSINKAKH